MDSADSDPTAVPRAHGKLDLTPEGTFLAALWAITTATLVVMLVLDVRYTEQYGVIRYALHAVFVAALLWYLAGSGPDVGDLPDINPPLLRSRVGAWLPVIGGVLILALVALSDDGIDILLLLLMLATIWILVAFWRAIRLKPVVQGLVLALAAYLAGQPAASNGFVGESTILLLAGLSAPMYVAGALLFGRTRLGGVKLLTGGYGRALRHLGWGCLLFLPLGLFNAAEGSPGTDITWVTEWWMPLSLPWFSGISEEIWFRLLLVSLCYFLLRPVFRARPGVAVVAAVLFSGITFGLGHDRTLERFLTTGLLYGVPMAAVFARRDLEHAVGAHYMINLVPWIMVFLEGG